MERGIELNAIDRLLQLVTDQDSDRALSVLGWLNGGVIGEHQAAVLADDIEEDIKNGTNLDL